MAVKKSYKKPEMKMVKLTPEEAVLAGCKNAAGTGRSGRRCTKSGALCRNNQVGS